jgi:hypothetical protein
MPRGRVGLWARECATGTENERRCSHQQRHSCRNVADHRPFRGANAQCSGPRTQQSRGDYAPRYRHDRASRRGAFRRTPHWHPPAARPRQLARPPISSIHSAKLPDSLRSLPSVLRSSPTSSRSDPLSWLRRSGAVGCEAIVDAMEQHPAARMDSDLMGIAERIRGLAFELDENKLGGHLLQASFTRPRRGTASAGG